MESLAKKKSRRRCAPMRQELYKGRTRWGTLFGQAIWTCLTKACICTSQQLQCTALLEGAAHCKVPLLAEKYAVRAVHTLRYCMPESNVGLWQHQLLINL
eukprot:TRINITY_DN5332_c0_g1_i2.p2 TRINITY_DN5332_c0_g1~~TRINITY_DN5332_c0_g1_i2.p2  ORF type:complete len:100 (+),score=4.15 TRINITY_DN5332_c0_g1_i2:588-887(+)